MMHLAVGLEIPKKRKESQFNFDHFMYQNFEFS